MQVTEYDNTCTITCTDNDKIVEAEVENFKKGHFVDVWIAQNKMKMTWNGKVYVGNKMGLEFTTNGPKEFNINRRGF
jgi:hypothetical protein